jgi:ferredoxin
MKNLIYYFSATGNTERAVGLIAEELRSAGEEVELEPIRAGSPPQKAPAEADRIVVAFPTLAMVPPVMVQRFIRRLPSGRRKDGSAMGAAVFTADGGGCGPSPTVAARMLRRRGYAVSLSLNASYAENWTQVGLVPATDEDAERKTARGDAMAREYGRKLATGVEEHHVSGPAERIVGTFFAAVFPPIGRRFLGKTYFAGAACDSCGLCKRTCPVGAIVIGSGKRARPYWKANCEDCNRCINVCPRKAINFSVPRAVLLLGVVVAASVLGLSTFYDLAWPGLVPLLPPWSRGLVGAFMDLGIIALAHVAIWPADAFFLRFFQRIPPVGRFFALSFTGGTRRYLAPGYKPKAR